MSRSYYSSEIQKFLEEPIDQILGHLARSNQFELQEQQRNAWVAEITILKEELEDLTSATVLFEYTIPRMGKRADVILILNGLIFVLEFKINQYLYSGHDMDQCLDYALDLKYFHEESRNAKIIQILIATDAVDLENNFKQYADGVFITIKCNKNNLKKTILRLSQEFGGDYIDPTAWENSIYKPTPTIIEAAQALYQGHNVREISRSDSGAENLTRTADAINKIIEKSKKDKTKSICFITGVPGAGKTLAGLNLANERHKISEEEHAVFLSGNGPLVRVLQEALARNKVKNSQVKIKKNEALRESSTFIQNIHHFRDNALEDKHPPIEKVVVFDEAQRAWDQKQTSSFMLRKRGKRFGQSEPEFLINVMDRHQDWCVIVCLIGGGQEINRGQAGLLEWFSAIKTQFKHWQVYVSNEISDTDPCDWFLNSKNDIRSCYFLEYVATEFDIQGLELDWVCVAWDADFRSSNQEWTYYKFSGTSWKKIQNKENLWYLKNAYRVLLTRARQGLVIFIPEGNENDSTAKSIIYNGTYEYLKEIGLKDLA